MLKTPISVHRAENIAAIHEETTPGIDTKNKTSKKEQNNLITNAGTNKYISTLPIFNNVSVFIPVSF
jgi:hypothetical protein